MSNTTESVKPRLDRPTFDQIAIALGRLEDIKQLSPLATTREIEREALTLADFLSKELHQHAAELLGCWFVVKSEYEPLINVLVPVVNRANSLISLHRVQAKAALATNVVPFSPV